MTIRCSLADSLQTFTNPRNQRLTAKRSSLGGEQATPGTFLARCGCERFSRPDERSRRWRFLKPLFVLIFLLLAASPSIAQDSETTTAQAAPDDLERYLDRLGFEDLLIAHLNQRVSTTTDTAVRNVIGQRLANRYADRLTQLASDPIEFNRTLEDVRHLLTQVPEADTLALRVMLSQAEYLRAEETVSKWMEQRDNTSLRDEALDQLNKITPGLYDSREELTKKITRINQQLGDQPNEEDTARLENELRQTQVVQYRANYFSGWANYYAGILSSSSSQRDRWLKESEFSFRQFMNLDPTDDILDVRVDWIDLSSVLQARGFGGLGLTLAALNEPEASERVFRILAESSAPQVVQASVPFWRLLASLNSNQLERTEQIAEEYVKSIQGSATQDQTRMFVALIRYKESPPPKVTPPDSFRTLGLEGLVRLRQFKLARELIEQYSFDVPENDDFYMLWLRGNLAFTRGEETGNITNYQQATELFEEALATPQAEADLRSSGHCHYQLGWSRFFSNDFETAADAFERATLLLENIDPETAANAAWKKYECFQKLSSSEARFQVLAMESLRTLIVSFPGTRLAKSAEYHLARLERSRVSLEESIASLESVAPTSSGYVSARYELCLLYHRQWNNALMDDEATDAPLAALQEAIRTYQDAARNETAVRRVKVDLLMVDVGLRSNPPDLELARDYLDRIQAGAERLPVTNTVAAEYHYQRFQLARREDRQADAEAEAEWLIDYAPDSIYVESALVLVARSTDRELTSATGDQRAALLQRSHRIYEQLTQLLGTDPTTLNENKNARVALYRLANLELEMGRPTDAAQRFERLLTLNDKSEVYLRAAGLAWFDAKQYQKSLDYWRTLSNGLGRGTERWFESRYYVIQCLERLDADEARSVLSQFRLLYPAPKAEGWEQRFQALETRLKATAR